MECVIDTSVLVDYILMDAEMHEKAKAGLAKIDTGFIPAVVIEELVHVLERLKLNKKALNEKIGEVLDSYELLSIDKVTILNAKSMIMEEGVSFKRFNDKLILSAAKREDLQLFTFDKELIDECIINGVNPFKG